MHDFWRKCITQIDVLGPTKNVLNDNWNVIFLYSEFESIGQKNEFLFLPLLSLFYLVMCIYIFASPSFSFCGSNVGTIYNLEHS